MILSLRYEGETKPRTIQVPNSTPMHSIDILFHDGRHFVPLVVGSDGETDGFVETPVYEVRLVVEPRK